MSEPRSDAPSQRTPSRPADRYGDAQAGSPVMGKLVAVVLALLVGAIMVASGVTIYRLNATPDVSAEVIGVEVVDDGLVGVSMTVSRDEPGVAAYCIVRAQDQSKGEVGRREVFVPPSENGTIQIDTEIVTTARAFIADDYGCGTDIPDYLRN